jgi:hypothetical protein
MDEKDKDAPENVKKHKLPEEKVEDLIRDIKDIGFKVDQTEEGIKISE